MPSISLMTTELLRYTAIAYILCISTVASSTNESLYPHQELLADTETDSSSITESGSNTWQYLLLGLSGVFIIVAVIMCCQLYRTRNRTSLLPMDETSRTMSSQIMGQPNNALSGHIATVSALEHIYPVHLFQGHTPLSSTMLANDDCEKNLKHLLHETCNQTCIICLEEFVPEVSLVRSLPCQHTYHAGCIDQWLTTRSNLCPLCKAVCIDTRSTETEGTATPPSSTDLTENTAHSQETQQNIPVITVVERDAQPCPPPEFYRLY